MDKPFLKVVSPSEVLSRVSQFPTLLSEVVDLDFALNRTLAQDVYSSEDIPAFHRSTMDGFAVRAKDTFGASESSPALLELMGEIPMASIPSVSLKKGATFRIWTGGALPDGADAVVMLEKVEILDDCHIEALQAVAPFENVVRRGEDIKDGQQLFFKGQRLRPADLGALAAIGATEAPVYIKPKVALISSGDEIVSESENPGPGQMRDVNRICLASMIRQAHSTPFWIGIVPDKLDAVESAIDTGLKEAHMVIISGGSSMGSRDLVMDAIGAYEDSNALVHGVSISPGKPFILAKVNEKPIVGLPGHPVSAMVCFESFVVPLLRRLEGEKSPQPYIRPSVNATLTRNIPSKEGRLDFVRVRLDSVNGAYTATPILGKSGMITTMSQAHGYVKIPEDCEGLYKNQLTQVSLFSDWISNDGIET